MNVIQEGSGPNMKQMSGIANKAIAPRTQAERQPNKDLNGLLTKDKPKSSEVAIPFSNGGNEVTDIHSSMGRFGWTFLGNQHIPYLIREDEKYCSVRMVEMKVLNTFLNCLRQDLYNFINIASYNITKNEARLLNEISFWHCNTAFGKQTFKPGDLIVRLSDATEFYNFLKHCRDKIVNSAQMGKTNRCGFIRINKESVMPFTVSNGKKFLPLFYLEGDMERLKHHAEKVDGWDLSYLKFCFQIQGIRNELFEQDFLSVICLDYIKNFFPPGTVFEDYWPTGISSQLLISTKLRIPQIRQWVSKPAIGILPLPKPAAPAKAATMPNSGGNTIYFRIDGVQSVTHSIPPLVGAETTNPGPITNFIGNQTPAAHQTLAVAQTLQPSTLSNNGHNTTSTDLPIPIVPCQTPQIVPYKVQTAKVDGKLLKVINLEPFDFTVFFVTLQDLVNNIFIGVPVQSLRQALQVLNINVYNANGPQRLLLMKQGKFKSITETSTLVELKNVLNFMAPIKYMLRKQQQTGDERNDQDK